ncbi:hypothetical protein CK203_108158 [Vitis vinifera]|uniref:Uncharacterized protein n=1 Tax=Vitis vinifera TaxID=29760 RepID=A0A438DJL6_VITVI|nr:hypothetical protein CK203_108158 [Vitis vinifera]
MPNWIRDSGGRLVKRDTPHNKELELSLNIMEATPEDQHSHQGRQDNLNEFRSMRDRASTSYECTIMYSAPYRAASDQTVSCSTSTNFPWDGNYFYDGMSSSMKQLLETMCGGDFMSKNPEEAMDFLSYVAEVSRGWDEPTKGEKIGGAGTEKVHEVQAVAEAPVQLKGKCLRSSKCCWTIQANNNAPYGNTYNSSWRNHPNFSWKARATQYQQPDQPSQQSSSLEQAIANLSKVVGDFVGNQKPSMLNSIKELTEWRVL